MTAVSLKFSALSNTKIKWKEVNRNFALYSQSAGSFLYRFKIRHKRKNGFYCIFTRHWIIIACTALILFLLFVNFWYPYKPVVKPHKTSNIKVPYSVDSPALQQVAPLQIHHIDKQNVMNTAENVPHENHEDLEENGDQVGHCETIHVALVCSGYKSNLYLHTMLKSIYFYRENPIYFHIIVNQVSGTVLKTLFATWNVPKVNVTFYDVHEYMADVRWVPNNHYSGIYGLLKLVFPKIIPTSMTNKLIVLDTDLIFVEDILQLWQLFEKFTGKQVVGLVENQSDYYLGKLSRSYPWPAVGRGFNTGVMLYHLENLKKIDWTNLWVNVTKQAASLYGTTGLGDQDVINAVIKSNPHIVYEVPCYWNTQLSDHSLSDECYRKYKIKVVHWNSPKKINVVNKDSAYFQTVYTTFSEYNGNLLRRQLYECKNFLKVSTEAAKDVCAEFRKAQSSPWRTLLFFREFKYTPMNEDITLVAQLSYDRLQMVEDLVKYWKGPLSLALYVTDPEFLQTIAFIENSDVLQDRLDVAYHAVFKDGEYYPINTLRNVALENVNTPYVFLSDVDFLPMKGLYDVLRNQIRSMKSLVNKALIIPAFETQRYKSMLPKNKKQLLDMVEKKYVFPFRFDVWAAGHAPINYTKWKTAVAPYKVEWKPDFEPYVVVRSDVTRYDNRFMGFGWNKVSHIMELEAQNYDFIVLPNAFMVHKSHAPSYDIAKFRSSPVYRMCLQNLKEEFVAMLLKKYGRVFSNKNASSPSVTK